MPEKLMAGWPTCAQLTRSDDRAVGVDLVLIEADARQKARKRCIAMRQELLPVESAA